MLITGDIVQDQIVPDMPNDEASPKNWMRYSRMNWRR